MEEVYSFLSRGLEMLHALGATGQIRIEIGAVGLLGTQWPGQFQYERSDALIDRVKVSQSRRKWDEAAIDELMLEVAKGGQRDGRRLRTASLSARADPLDDRASVMVFRP